MNRIVLFVCMLSLAGCASLVEQLKDDPAIVGGTFTGIKLSVTAVPGLPIPIPEIIIGRGTFYRIGGDRTVEVMAGDTTGATLSTPSSQGGSAAQPQSGQLSVQGAKSEASMTIKAGEIKAGELKEKSPPRAAVR